MEAALSMLLGNTAIAFANPFIAVVKG